MKRYLCWLAVLGVATVPDWASAYYPCYCPPPPCGVSYGSPVVYAPAQFAPVAAMPSAPIYDVAMGPPRGYPIRRFLGLVLPPYGNPARPTILPPRAQVPPRYAIAPPPAPVILVSPPVLTTPAPSIPRAMAATPSPAPAPKISEEPTFRPAGGTTPAAAGEPVRPAVDKTPAPMSPATPPKVTPDPVTSAPMPTVVPDPPTLAPKSNSDSKLPPLVLPMPPSGSDAKPDVKPDPKPDVKLEPKSGGTAIPSAAPSPPDPGPTLLPLEPKKPADGNNPLPPLVLPPDGPSVPTGIVPTTDKERESRSSPLAARGMNVQVFPAVGSVVGATRKVGFFNHTDRDIDLVIEGKAVTLPRKSFINAELSPTFKWKYGDNPTQTATVPEGAAGLDVLFRE